MYLNNNKMCHKSFRALAGNVYIFILSNQILTFIRILTIVSYRSEAIPISAEAEDDISLKQALFLVELLKSDFAKGLRQNNNFNNDIINTTEIDDSTCPPKLIDDFNTTSAENLTVTIGFARRRMTPDYYYFDSPIRSQGQFRRKEGGDPTSDFAKETVTTPAQTTTNITTATSEVTTLRVEERPVSTSIFPITITNRTSPTPTGLSTQPRMQSSTQPSAESPTQLLTELSYQPTTRRSNQVSTKPRRTKQASFRKRTPSAKATTKIIYNRNGKLNLNNVDGPPLRHRESTTVEVEAEEVVMSQVESELIKEFNGTKAENIVLNKDPTSKNDSKPQLKKKLSTMKIFLKGSTRLAQPLPENNAFCHHHPNNPLCGTKL